MNRKFSRREFMEWTARGTIGLVGTSWLSKASANFAGELNGKSIVVVVKDEYVLDQRRKIQAGIIQKMVDVGIRNLTGINEIGPAWQSLFPDLTPQKTISIKVNCINHHLSSHPEVAYAIANGLTQMKINDQYFPAENIIIWDRRAYELRAAGYVINQNDAGVRCYATDSSGIGHSPTKFDIAGKSEYISKIITDKSDYLINLSVLKNHWLSGITLSMKNHYGSCGDPGKLHGSNGDPYLPALTAIAPIRAKQVLCICDALLGIISGGPGGAPQVMPKSLIFSQDPVAHDFIGAELLKANGCRTTGSASFLKTASNPPYNLGTNNPDEIIRIDLDTTSSGVQADRDESITDCRLWQNYPNPFNATTTISYQLAEPGPVNLRIYDLRGGLVRELVNTVQPAGYHQVRWGGLNSNNRPVASGCYLAQLQQDQVRQTIRMQLIK